MGLGDVAGPADHGRDAELGLKQAALGAEGDLAVLVGADQGLDEGDDLLVRIGVEPGIRA